MSTVATTAPEKFNAALTALVEQIKQDRSVLAAILCGSLSHDTVWTKSDIDLVLITIDDKKVPAGDLPLNADGVNVHALLLPRADFRQTAEGSFRNSFMHSLLAKGRLLYSHDDSIVTIFNSLSSIGERDTELQLLNAACHAISVLNKAHKWLLTRGDLDYTALWILYTATPLARIEILSRRLLADREVIPQALKLNPEFFGIIYSDMLNKPKTRENIEAALALIDQYIADRAPKLFALVINHLRDVREARSTRDINDHFARNYGLEDVTIACEYLADQGLIGKAAIGAQLTRRSNVEVQELAFFSLG